MIEFHVEQNETGERLDVFLRSKLRYSRSAIAGWIKKDLIHVNQGTPEPSYLVQAGDAIDVIIPQPIATALTPQKIPLDILYEDDDLIVVNKPKGMVIYPSPGHSEGTLMNAILAHDPVFIEEMRRIKNEESGKGIPLEEAAKKWLTES